MTLITIDGNTYNVPIIGIKRRADALEKYAERTADGNLNVERIGIYYNYSLQMGTTYNLEAYAALWDKLSEPEVFHDVTVPDGYGEQSFSAYFSNVNDEMRRQRASENFWKNLQFNMISRRPARTP